jgi:hypothetical protein
MLHEFQPLSRNAFGEEQDRRRCTFGRTKNQVKQFTDKSRTYLSRLIRFASTQQVFDVQEEFVWELFELKRSLHRLCAVVKAVKNVVHQEKNSNLTSRVGLEGFLKSQKLQII